MADYLLVIAMRTRFTLPVDFGQIKLDYKEVLE
jgi:hypothetical protein